MAVEFLLRIMAASGLARQRLAQGDVEMRRRGMQN
jgi:hypothetical protein